MGAAGRVAEASLRLRGLTCMRGGRLLFGGLDLALGAGDAALVTGANGAGKSSLLRIVAGLLAPTGGEVARSGTAALAGEALALDGARPLGHALAFWARLDGAIDRLPGALAAMALEPIAEVPVRMLSTGQRKRAILARVIAAPAPIWLLDEPANGLDAASVDRLGAAIVRHRADGGVVLAASHQPLDLPGAIEVRL